MTIDWPRFAEVIRAPQRFILTSHMRPDCDALGSELAMAGVLEAIGKQVLILNGQSTPPNFAFIDPTRRIKAVGVDYPPDAVPQHDALMVLDTSAWAQLGPMADVVRASTAKKIILDHHVSSDDLGAETFKNTTAEATGRLVMEAAGKLGVKITREIALPMFAAIATDTGWFRFASTTSDTYRRAAELIDAGVRPEKLYHDLYEQDTLARLKLTGRILARTEAELGGRLIHTYVMREDFDAVGALPSDTEDVINMTLGVAGTQFAVIFVEQKGGNFKVSLRSRCDAQCNQLAEKFGGGGHRAAAGAFVPGPLETAQKAVLDAVRAAMT